MSKLTRKRQIAFIEALRVGVSIGGSAKLVGVSRQAVYQLKDRDPKFAQAWDDAVEIGTDALEDVALRRAKDQSDTLLIFLLKARRPQKYRDRLLAEHVGKDGGPIQHEHDLSGLSDEQLVELEQLVNNGPTVKPNGSAVPTA